MNEIPLPLAQPDFTKLIAACKEYMEALAIKAEAEEVDENYENAIFEKAVEAVYGLAVWDWMNARLK